MHMMCPVCGAAEMVHDTRDISYAHNGATTEIRAVTGDFCPACNECITGPAESERVMREMRAFSEKIAAPKS